MAAPPPIPSCALVDSMASPVEARWLANHPSRRRGTGNVIPSYPEARRRRAVLFARKIRFRHEEPIRRSRRPRIHFRVSAIGLCNLRPNIRTNRLPKTSLSSARHGNRQRPTFSAEPPERSARPRWLSSPNLRWQCHHVWRPGRRTKLLDRYIRNFGWESRPVFRHLRQ